MVRLALHWQVMIALLLAAAVGAWQGPDGALVPVLAFLGTLFLNALKMLIVPLIVSSIISGLLGLADRGAIGRLGLKTAVYYMSTSAVAIVTGLLVVNLLTPGIVDGNPAGASLGLHKDTAEVVATVQQGSGSSSIWALILRLVPSNVFAAAANGDMLGLIFFSLLFGGIATSLNGRDRETQQSFWAGMNEIMMRITDLVMKLAPIGVFALVGKVVATTGWDGVKPVMVFFACVVIALAIHTFITLPLVLKLVARVSPLAHFSAMSPAMLTAFSTSSSSATLPVTMDCVQERAGVSPGTSGFVLPLGATINMDGTALYECVAAMFIAQAYGLELSFGVQLLVVWMALLTSIGVAGIPSASLIAIAVILGAVGLPLEGLGLILAVDRVLDMFRTSVNVFSDSCGAVVIARLEGEETKLLPHTRLS